MRPLFTLVVVDNGVFGFDVDLGVEDDLGVDGATGILFVFTFLGGPKGPVRLFLQKKHLLQQPVVGPSMKYSE